MSPLERLCGAFADANHRSLSQEFRFLRWLVSRWGRIAVTGQPGRDSAFDDHVARLKTNTLTRRVAAVVRIHRLLGLPNPKDDEEVWWALRWAKRFRSARPRQAYGITRDLHSQMIESCGDVLKGLRDRALVSLGFEGLCPLSEISALSFEDLVEKARGGMSVVVRRGNVDQEEQGRIVALSPATVRLVLDLDRGRTQRDRTADLPGVS